ncbi:dTDP-4-dehydrorhamnose 3,5-epimerase [Helicobacter cinaedi]|uniref:dTDP-4-dehydrorhamnose 3,5-epimerase n=1 Tax=Helicobacter cinaedi TaxID=213 RepID=UPI000D7BB68B|nr:dTDP-4-dehydrorhamnose 3,5-epimerase [Helicobacter cinaedi]
MERFSVLKTSLKGVSIVTPKQIKDGRGYFERYFCSNEFKEIGLTKPIVQINHSFTRQKGSVRGMHFQTPPHSETKIVRCLSGAIYDVVVDIRADSPTFLQHFGITLSKRNNKYLYIPEGFAHGFQTLTNNVEMLYLATAAFEKTADNGLNPLDPLLSIEWKLDVTNISEKDKNAQFITSTFVGIKL